MTLPALILVAGDLRPGPLKIAASGRDLVHFQTLRRWAACAAESLRIPKHPWRKTFPKWHRPLCRPPLCRHPAHGETAVNGKGNPLLGPSHHGPWARKRLPTTADAPFWVQGEAVCGRGLAFCLRRQRTARRRASHECNSGDPYVPGKARGNVTVGPLRTRRLSIVKLLGRSLLGSPPKSRRQHSSGTVEA